MLQQSFKTGSITNQQCQTFTTHKPNQFKGNKDYYLRPHSHTCKASIADQSNPSLQRREDKSSLLGHSLSPETIKETQVTSSGTPTHIKL